MHGPDAHQFVVTARYDAVQALARQGIQTKTIGEMKPATMVEIENLRRRVIFATGLDGNIGPVGHFRFEQGGPSWWGYDVFLKPSYDRFAISQKVVEFLRNGAEPEFPQEVVTQDSRQRKES